MRTDNYGQIIYNEDDLVNLYYTNPELKLRGVLIDNPITFDFALELENLPELIEYMANNQSVEEFDSERQKNWFMPMEYYNLDIASYVLSLCQTDEELQRVGAELLLYQDRNMFNLLK